MRINNRQAGQSLVEVLIAAFILGILAIALAGVSTLGTKTAVVSEERTVAQAIANKREELIKLTPYVDVGYTGGSVPDGIFPASEVIDTNNQVYEMRMDITLVDDPENGCVDAGGTCDGSTLDEETADYKRVVISVVYPSANDAAEEVKVVTYSVPGQAEALLNMVECDPTDITGSCGAGQICCNERCLARCDPGSCPEGYSCAENGCGCVEADCPWCDLATCFDDFECVASNQQCLAGNCVAECASDGDCGGATCLYGWCLESCINNSECNGDQICQDGSCQMPGCVTNYDCRVGYSCTDFQCHPTTCVDDAYCPANFECVENTCMPAVCADGTCPGSWECVYGKCQPPNCSAVQSCNSLNCLGGECQPPVCENHGQCGGLAVCLGGTCTSPPACGAGCPASLSCVGGLCYKANMTVAPLLLTEECPAPMAFPCLPAIGEVTVTWLPVEGEIYCEPSVTTGACTTDPNPTVEWSDTDGDGKTNCGASGLLNACEPINPIECGSSCPGCPSCAIDNLCIEGRCMPKQPCPVGYANHPTVAGACAEEVLVSPPVTCPPGICTDSYCSASGQCVTAGCVTDEQCGAHGKYLCRNNICIPSLARDCEYCTPPERISYCHTLDCPTCGGGPGSACTDPLGAASTVVWSQDRTTGCSHLICAYAPSLCGDGITQPGEECDGGDDVNCPGLCSACQCPAAVCGNGQLEIGETCDPPEGTSCSPAECGTGGAPPCLCQTQAPPPLCGNGLIDTLSGEGCDWSVSPDSCVGGYCSDVCVCEYP